MDQAIEYPRGDAGLNYIWEMVVMAEATFESA